MPTPAKFFLRISVFFLTVGLVVTLKDALGEPQPIRPFSPQLSVNVGDNLQRLISDEDTDGDKKITVEDTRVGQRGRGDKRFWLITASGQQYEVVGTYYLSNLLQELKLAQDVQSKIARISPGKVFESPVRRISRLIREIYWNGLTRRIDGQHLEQILRDEKLGKGGVRILHVPHTDGEAYQYFSRIKAEHPKLRLQVERLPAKLTCPYRKPNPD